MKRAAVLAIFLSACASTPAFFDGASLAGWQTSGAATWLVEAGEIIGSGEGNGFIATLADFSDFELSLDFYVDDDTNSGVFIRCQQRDNIHPNTCYELNIWDRHPVREARTGAIVFHVMPPLVDVNTLGRWNTFQVRAVGGRVEIRLNNQLTAVLEDAEYASGFIALQRWEYGRVRFRNLELKEL